MPTGYPSLEQSIPINFFTTRKVNLPRTKPGLPSEGITTPLINKHPVPQDKTNHKISPGKALHINQFPHNATTSAHKNTMTTTGKQGRNLQH
jgi:hypothetical protein